MSRALRQGRKRRKGTTRHVGRRKADDPITDAQPPQPTWHIGTADEEGKPTTHLGRPWFLGTRGKSGRKKYPYAALLTYGAWRRYRAAANPT